MSTPSGVGGGVRVGADQRLDGRGAKREAALVNVGTKQWPLREAMGLNRCVEGVGEEERLETIQLLSTQQDQGRFL